MEAKDDEKDRRKIWEDNRATQLDFVQCVRVFTSASGGVTEQIMSLVNKTLCTSGVTASASDSSIDKSAISSTGSTASGATSSGSSTSCTGTGSSTLDATQSASTATSAISNLSEYNDKIAELTSLAKEALGTFLFLIVYNFLNIKFQMQKKKSVNKWSKL